MSGNLILYAKLRSHVDKGIFMMISVESIEMGMSSWFVDFMVAVLFVVLCTCIALTLACCFSSRYLQILESHVDFQAQCCDTELETGSGKSRCPQVTGCSQILVGISFAIDIDQSDRRRAFLTKSQY